MLVGVELFFLKPKKTLGAVSFCCFGFKCYLGALGGSPGESPGGPPGGSPRRITPEDPSEEPPEDPPEDPPEVQPPGGSRVRPGFEARLGPWVLFLGPEDDISQSIGGSMLWTLLTGGRAGSSGGL